MSRWEAEGEVDREVWNRAGELGLLGWEAHGRVRRSRRPRLPVQRDSAEECLDAGLKQWTTDRRCEVLDRCLQLQGGCGYMNDYEIARLWHDGRVVRTYGGANEVMREVVGRLLKLGVGS